MRFHGVRRRVHNKRLLPIPGGPSMTTTTPTTPAGSTRHSPGRLSSPDDELSPAAGGCCPNTWRAEDQLEPILYQICVRGRLTERLAAALDGMTLHASRTDTVFVGEVRDQSHLYG